MSKLSVSAFGFAAGALVLSAYSNFREGADREAELFALNYALQHAMTEQNLISVGSCSDDLKAFEGADKYCRIVEQALEDVRDHKVNCDAEYAVFSIRMEQEMAAEGLPPEHGRHVARLSDLMDYQKCLSGVIDDVNFQLHSVFSKTVLANVDLELGLPVAVVDEWASLSSALPYVNSGGSLPDMYRIER